MRVRRGADCEQDHEEERGEIEEGGLELDNTLALGFGRGRGRKIAYHFERLCRNSGRVITRR